VDSGEVFLPGKELASVFAPELRGLSDRFSVELFVLVEICSSVSIRATSEFSPEDEPFK
jgi:hypothetical protein